MEEAKVHQGLQCCSCWWWWVPLESSCKLLCSSVSWCGTRLAANYLLHKVWVRILKKDVDTFASSAISWLLCLSSSNMLLTPTTKVSSSAINRLLLLYHLQRLSGIPGGKMPTMKLCCDPLYSPHKLKDVQCYSTLWQVTIFHMMVSGIFP